MRKHVPPVNHIVNRCVSCFLCCQNRSPSRNCLLTTFKTSAFFSLSQEKMKSGTLFVFFLFLLLVNTIQVIATSEITDDTNGTPEILPPASNPSEGKPTNVAKKPSSLLQKMRQFYYPYGYGTGYGTGYGLGWPYGMPPAYSYGMGYGLGYPYYGFAYGHHLNQFHHNPHFSHHQYHHQRVLDRDRDQSCNVSPCHLCPSLDDEKKKVGHVQRVEIDIDTQMSLNGK